MQTAIQITRARDLHDDHEYDSQDLPDRYTAEVVAGRLDDAVALMTEGLAIEALASSTTLPAEAGDWIHHCLAVLPAAGRDYMDPDDRARWAIQYPALKAQYEALQRLWG